MSWQPGETRWINAAGKRLEGRCWGPAPDTAPTLVLLHEGLGSAGLWKDFPERLAERTGYGVFAYSRAGYGASDPAALPRPLNYMTREAVDVLPQVLDAIGFRRGVLLGHSDGASIAALYAGTIEDFRVRGLCLISPHFFTEPSGLAAIAEARAQYETGELRERLARHHRDVDNAFRGWNDAWLDPVFKTWNIEEAIAYIRVPVLAIQGDRDQYGTLAQIDALRNGLYSPLDTKIFIGGKHAPHLERAEETVDVVADFLARLDRIEAAAGLAARGERVA
jgi:pimeloyl-ACP methyl ester carboxylesterase